MKDLAVFRPYVTTDVLGCPIPTVDHRIILACRDFCDKSGIWREWQDLRTMDGTTNAFDHDLTSDQELVCYTRAIVNDDKDGEYNILSWTDLPPDWKTNASQELTKSLVHIDLGQFMLFPAPVAGDTLRIEAVLKPAITSTQVPDILYDRFCADIAAGALAKLQMLPGQPWTNPQMAAHNLSLFNAAVASAGNFGFSQRSAKRTRKAPL